MPAVDRDGPVPPWRQIYDVLRAQIQAGEIPPDRALPSKRTLCEEYDVTVHTVEKALRMLKNDGMIRTSSGMGNFVTDPAAWTPSS